MKWLSLFRWEGQSAPGPEQAFVLAQHWFIGESAAPAGLYTGLPARLSLPVLLVGGRMSLASAELHSNITPSQRRSPMVWISPGFPHAHLLGITPETHVKKRFCCCWTSFWMRRGERKCFPATGLFLHHTKKAGQVRGRPGPPMSVPTGTSLPAGNTQGAVSSGASPRAAFPSSVCQPAETLSQNASISMPEVQACTSNTRPQPGREQGRSPWALDEVTWKARHRDIPEAPTLSGAKVAEPAWKPGTCVYSGQGGLVCIGDSCGGFLPLYLYRLSALLVSGRARPPLLMYWGQPRCG